MHTTGNYYLKSRQYELEGKLQNLPEVDNNGFKSKYDWYKDIETGEIYCFDHEEENKDSNNSNIVKVEISSNGTELRYGKPTVEFYSNGDEIEFYQFVSYDKGIFRNDYIPKDKDEEFKLIIEYLDTLEKSVNDLREPREIEVIESMIKELGNKLNQNNSDEERKFIEQYINFLKKLIKFDQGSIVYINHRNESNIKNVKKYLKENFNYER